MLWLQVNTEGLKRRGFSSESIENVRKAYKILYRSNLTLDKAKEEIEKLAVNEPCLLVMVDFLNDSQRGIIR